jgi:deazaflavin-dependent oxidoreductase (nitroreductase family)
MTDFDPDAWTRNMIADLRANGGTPSSGPLVGRPLAIMTSKGAKTGEDRTAIVTHHRDGDAFVIAATKGGADEHPAWYHNLVAHPDVTFEAANDTLQLVARETSGDERQRLYDDHARLYPEFRGVPEQDQPRHSRVRADTRRLVAGCSGDPIVAPSRAPIGPARSGPALRTTVA